MKTLDLKEMENIGGGAKDHCGTFTGLMCSATLILCFTPFAPLAGATGPACLVGIASGCTN